MAPPPTTAVPSDFVPLTGHCNCKALTYTLKAMPMIIHCCHCTWCQRESGSAFALNAQIECYNLSVNTPPSSPSKQIQPNITHTPSPSGAGQIFASCPSCNVVLYTHYGGNMSRAYVKVGTLDDASRQRVRPDVHLFTTTKLDWVDLSREVENGVKCFEGFYEEESDAWSESGLERLAALRAWAAQEKGL
ncbi:unnamed protein product [Periconia digitata]|uniref:CENP-V/GFA domain-containing protein n=1 Tax=Periconia digitata TaxID=1303443 RepID=A0A9W4UJ47_9PLEO|nr:unnamed protein product [Periconia digitata]